MKKWLRISFIEPAELNESRLPDQKSEEFMLGSKYQTEIFENVLLFLIKLTLLYAA